MALAKLKIYGRFVLAGLGFVYDLKRYFMFAGWRSDFSSQEERNYYMVRVYHALEKSMSFRRRRPGSGWKHAELLIDALENAKNYRHGIHDVLAFQVLEKFHDIEKVHTPEKSKNLKMRLDEIESCYNTVDYQEKPGVIEFSCANFEQGMLGNPESFFLSRHSLREFSGELVKDSEVKRAVKLAMKSPSVCNRQAWHVYHLQGEIIQNALAFQNGNRGFGENIQDLLIIATDLPAFCSPKERYQHWIDGGMFAMSMVWALHSLGIASCCLNWSQSGRVDMQLRDALPIQPNHTVIMMVAIGYPSEHSQVCSSVRRPVSEVLTKLDGSVL